MNLLHDVLVGILLNPEVLQAVALMISIMLVWFLRSAISWMGLKLRSTQIAMLESVVDKALTAATVRAEHAIAARGPQGWSDHTVRRQVLEMALPILRDRFHETLKNNGLSLDKEADRNRLQGMMERMLPDVFTRAAASPATPPADVIPAAIVAPAQGP